MKHAGNEESQKDNGNAHGENATLHSPISSDGTPEINRRYVVPARNGRAIKLRAGQVIRIINTHGSQVCDAWIFGSASLDEYFSIEHTRALLDKITPKVGDVLLTNRRRPIGRMVADTSPGVHDTLIAACDVYRYEALGVTGYHDNCSDNMRLALKAIGLRAGEVPQPFNLWMNIPINSDKSVNWAAPVSVAGDHVDIEAIMDCIVVLSACPQDLIQVNALNPKELEFVVLH